MIIPIAEVVSLVLIAVCSRGYRSLKARLGCPPGVKIPLLSRRWIFMLVVGPLPIVVTSSP